MPNPSCVNCKATGAVSHGLFCAACKLFDDCQSELSQLREGYKFIVQQSNQLRAENERLKKYAVHHAACRSRSNWHLSTKPECSCGLDAALSTLPPSDCVVVKRSALERIANHNTIELHDAVADMQYIAKKLLEGER